MLIGTKVKAAALILPGAFVVLACTAQQAAAQSRKQVGMVSPGYIRIIGDTSSSYYLRRYAYGLGQVEGYSPAPGGDVLRSSITGSASFSINRPSALTPQSGSSAETSGGTRSHLWRKPGAIEPITPLHSSRSRVPLELQTEDLALAVASEYFEETESSSSLLKKGSGPITSLVPQRESPFAAYLAKGEKAFREGRFEDALDQFLYANKFGPRVPEGLVSLAHCSFAVSNYSYGRAAFYLKESLKYFPELALTPLRPKAFYGDPDKFVEQLMRLEDHVSKDPEDTEALLVLAYFRWFQENPDAKTVQIALTQAMDVATPKGDRSTIEAVETFWNGIVAAGKASGELTPPTTQPVAGSETERGEEPEPAKDAGSASGA